MITFSKNKRGPIRNREHQRKNRAPRIAILVVGTVSSLICTLTFLSSQTDVPQITRATGTILPQDNYTQIETISGGIVREVVVRDGDLVEAGQLLVTLHNPDLTREFETRSEELSSSEAQLENVRAVLLGLSTISADLEFDVTDLLERGLANAAAELEVFIEGQQIFEISILQYEHTIATLTDAREYTNERVLRVENRLEQMSNLLDRGVITVASYQEFEDQADALRVVAGDALVRLAEARGALALLRAEQRQAHLTLREQMLGELAELQQRHEELLTQSSLLHSRLADLQLRAPVAGIVQAVAFPNNGEVIAPGETIFELSPINESLIFEARIPSRDIGHVNIGESVLISVDTFDARRHGKATGIISAISPVPLLDEQTGMAYFRASLTIQSPTIGSGAFERHLHAGMTAVAEITTGQQNLLSYLLGPIQTTISESFSER